MLKQRRGVDLILNLTRRATFWDERRICAIERTNISLQKMTLKQTEMAKNSSTYNTAVNSPAHGGCGVGFEQDGGRATCTSLATDGLNSRVNRLRRPPGERPNSVELLECISNVVVDST